MLEFLHRCRQQASHLILLGDMFEYLAGSNRTSHRAYAQVLRALAAWEQVDYVEGNHDFDLLADRLGVPGLCLHPEPTVADRSGLRIGLLHGDGCNPDDLGTRALKRALKSSGVRWLRDRILPDPLVHHFAMAEFRRRQTWPGRNEESQAVLRHARQWQASAKLDLVLFAHTHQAHLECSESACLVNPGAAQPGGSYAWLDDQGLSIRGFPDGQLRQGPVPLDVRGRSGA